LFLAEIFVGHETAIEMSCGGPHIKVPGAWFETEAPPIRTGY